MRWSKTYIISLALLALLRRVISSMLGGSCLHEHLLGFWMISEERLDSLRVFTIAVQWRRGQKLQEGLTLDNLSGPDDPLAPQFVADDRNHKASDTAEIHLGTPKGLV